MRGIRVSGIVLSVVAPGMWAMAWASELQSAPEGMATLMAAINGWMMSLTGSVLLLVSLLSKAAADEVAQLRGRWPARARWSAVVLAALSLVAMLALPNFLAASAGAFPLAVLLLGLAAHLSASLLCLAVPLPRRGAASPSG